MTITVRQEIPYGKVLEATREYMLATGGKYDGQTSTDYAFRSVAERVGFDLAGTTLSAYKDRDRFIGQVRRALDALAADGTLVKVGRDQPGPGGRQKAARYWTPAKYAEAKAEQLARDDAAALESARWAEVRDMLVWRGITVHSGYGHERGEPVEISLDGWEALLRG